MSKPSSTDKKVIPIAVAAPEAAPPESPTGAMIRTLGLVSAVCGLIIVGAYLASRRYLDGRIPLAVLGSAALTAWLRVACGPAR